MTVSRHARGLSSVEQAIVMPLLIVIIFATIQLATFFHARSTAQAAAASCAERARGYTSTLAQGEAAAHSLLAQVAGLRDPRVQASYSATVARCVVTGTAPTPLAIGPTTVSATVELSREQVR